MFTYLNQHICRDSFVGLKSDLWNAFFFVKTVTNVPRKNHLWIEDLIKIQTFSTLLVSTLLSELSICDFHLPNSFHLNIDLKKKIQIHYPRLVHFAIDLLPSERW